MNNFPIETLIKGRAGKTDKDKWYPTRVDTYRKNLKIATDNGSNDALRSNIAYNLQYLELLQKELDELELSASLRRMVIKTYIITGTAILEGIFAYTVHANSLWKRKNLEKIIKFTSNPKKNGEERYVAKTGIYKIVPEYDVPEIKLYELINILDNHQDTLKINYWFYKPMQKMRDLRNKIHLTDAEDNQDNDYHVFDDDVQAKMRGILYEVLTSDEISESTKYYDFLTPKKETEAEQRQDAPACE